MVVKAEGQEMLFVVIAVVDGNKIIDGQFGCHFVRFDKILEIELVLLKARDPFVNGFLRSPQTALLSLTRLA